MISVLPNTPQAYIIREHSERISLKKALVVASAFFWSRRRESNPHYQLGKLKFCH